MALLLQSAFLERILSPVPDTRHTHPHSHMLWVVVFGAEICKLAKMILSTSWYVD